MTAHPLVRRHLIAVVIAGLVLVAASCDDGGAAPVVTTPPVSANAAGSDTTEAAPASGLIPTIGSGSAATLCDDGSPPALGAFDLATGAVQWIYCSAEQAWRSVLGATDEVVYLNSVTREQTFELTALDANTGAELWRRLLAPPTELGMGDAQGPIAGGGVVVLKVNDGDGVATVGVDAGTGSERWRTASVPAADAAARGAADTAAGPVVVAGPGGPPAPILTPIANTEEMVVVGSFTGLRGLDRATGEERWTSPVALQDDSGVGVARGAAAVSGDTVIVPAGGNLVAIDARTGTQLWHGQGLHHPSAAEGFVVGYSRDGPSQKVSGLDAVTGETLWTAPGRPSYGDLWAIGGGTVSALDAAPGIVAYELATGAVRWRRDDVMGEPQSAVGDAVFTLWEAYVGVLSPTDGSTRWEALEPLGSRLMSSVGSNSGSLFVSVNSLPFTD